MSEQNVEDVRWHYEAINRFMWGDLSGEALLEQCDPQLEWSWHDRRTFPDEPQRVRGARAVLKFYEDLRETIDEVVVEPHEFIEAPDGRVFVSVRQTGRGRESGVPIVVHFFHLWTIREGKAIKQELFSHRADALKAAGLRE